MSRPAFDNLSLIRERVMAASHLLVGLDYDGTLTPIVDDPPKALLGLETREIVTAIAVRPNTSVAIVSGRRLQDVRTLVGIDGLIYAGNHGLEICGPGFRFTEPTAVKTQKALGWLSAALTNGLTSVAGAVVENKVLTISVHCRQVLPARLDEVFRHVQAAAAVAPGCFRVSLGNQVFEVRPHVDWHKGSAMCWIAGKLGKQNTLTIFVGDDRTDEDAFRALDDGITIKVGEPAGTSAHYHLDGPASVREFLIWLAKVGNEGGMP